MAVSKEKLDELQKRMEKLGVKNKDLQEKFILGSGKGGQKVNKTASCVYLKHLPTGIEIKCQQHRSRALNRFLARRKLCERIEGEILQIKTEKQKQIDKLRKQKKRRSRKQKEKMLEGKRRQSVKKALRRSPHEDNGI